MEVALYRKYKPRNFDDIVGQDLIKLVLLNSVKQNRISHAYILSGPRGIGKTSIAKILSKSVNCLNNQDGDCCNACDNCTFINNGSTADVIELDAASNNSVNDIRDMINNVNYLPHNLLKRVYIIDEAHMLSTSAWNAFLKTIEDPPKHVIFIFATTELIKIPSTIISRCQKFDLHRLTKVQIKDFIKKISKEEKYNISDEASEILANISDGSMRDALSMLDQSINASFGNQIEAEQIELLFGLTSIDTKIKIINFIKDKNFINLIELFDKLESRGVNFLNLCKGILEVVIDKIIFDKTNSFKNLRVLSEINTNNITISGEEFYKIIEILQKGLSEIKSNFDERFFFEITIWKCIGLFDLEEKQQLNKVSKNKQNLEIKIKEILIEPIKEGVLDLHTILTKNKQYEHDPNSDYENKNGDISNLYEIKTNINDKKDKNIHLDDVLKVRKSDQINKEIPDYKNDKEILFYKINPIDFNSQEIKTPEAEFEYLNNFYEIAFNNDNELKTKLNEILKIELLSPPINPIEGYISNAIKILVASKNGFVILFDDELSGINLNSISTSQKFIEYIIEKFGKIYLVIGISKSRAREFGINLSKEIKNGKKFIDCKIDFLKEKIKKNKSAKDIALDVFGDELLGK